MSRRLSSLLRLRHEAAGSGAGPENCRLVGRLPCAHRAGEGTAMKNRFVQVALGIMTSIGGYLDVGTIATSAEAGASFRYALIWSVVLGTVCLIFLIEMAGRLSAVSKHTIIDAVRE